MLMFNTAKELQEHVNEMVYNKVWRNENRDPIELQFSVPMAANEEFSKFDCLMGLK